jgi:hypothetical protein
VKMVGDHHAAAARHLLGGYASLATLQRTLAEPVVVAVASVIRRVESIISTRGGIMPCWQPAPCLSIRSQEG